MIVGFHGRNHPQQVRSRGAIDGVDDRATPPELFAQLHARFHFTLDVAATAENAKLPRYCTRAECGLQRPWDAERVWCNPPFSRLREWAQKAWKSSSADLIVMLAPANRTDQRWWQDLIEGRRDRPGSPLRTEFIAGRTRFLKPGQQINRPNERPPFGCVLLIWDHHGSLRHNDTIQSDSPVLGAGEGPVNP